MQRLMAAILATAFVVVRAIRTLFVGARHVRAEEMELVSAAVASQARKDQWLSEQRAKSLVVPIGGQHSYDVGF